MDSLQARAETVRAFNRFYTPQIHLLDEGMYASKFSLAEVRVLYELAHHEGSTASQISKDLGIDPGYLSRILLAFQKRGFIKKTF